VSFCVVNEEGECERSEFNVLFVCSMNQWRSPTAERIYQKYALLNCRSAGTSQKARRTIGVADLRWADLIIVMEQKHLERLRADFRSEIRHHEIHVLEVEDRYQFMDPELVKELRSVLDPILTEELGG